MDSIVSNKEINENICFFRKATYMVALKASRMNNMNSEQDGYNERELDYALERLTENDHDEHDQERGNN